MHQEPVYVDPYGAPPVLNGREPEAVAIVARYRVIIFCSQPKPRALHRLYHASGPNFIWDARKEGSEIGGHVSVDLLASDQIEVQVDPMLLVPELAFYGSGGLLCLF